MATSEHTTDSLKQNLIFEYGHNAELAFGRDEGTRTALWEIRDRTEFKRLLAALNRSRAAFLVELRSAQFVAEGGVSATPLNEFEDLMFGQDAGGVHGSYGSGFVSAFALLAPFVSSTH